MKNRQPRSKPRSQLSRRSEQRSKYRGDGTRIKSVEDDAKTILEVLTGGKK